MGLLPRHIRAIAYMLSCVKTEWWDAGVVVSEVRCRSAYGPADATATHYLLL